jgi:two-component system NtrC family sensor kinase
MKAFAHPDRSEKEPADLNLALRNTLTVATNELKYVATVETEFGDLPLVPCFLSDLNQVFLNLLVNAAHAIGDVVGKGGPRGVIGVRTYCEQDHAVVAISDTGTGIPAERSEQDFRPLLHHQRGRQGNGTGIGASTVGDRRRARGHPDLHHRDWEGHDLLHPHSALTTSPLA